MTTIDIDYFDLLSNEVVVNIVGFLDLVSLYRLTSTSKRLDAFKQISNEQWRRYYAQKWLLDDNELSIYKIDNWQQVYHARVKAENDYLLRMTFAPSLPAEYIALIGDQSEEAAGQRQDLLTSSYWRQPRANSNEEDIYYPATIDPWAFILLDRSDDPDLIKDELGFIEGFFSHEPFTDEDSKREVLSGRFEILVTGLSRYAAKNVEVLASLNLFEYFYSEDYKEQRKRPFGLLGLLAKYLDVTLPVHVLSAVTNAMWDVAASGEVEEDFFVGLNIVPKLMTIITKTTDISTKNYALAALTWFRPSKPENTKVLNNAAFMGVLVEMLFGDAITDNFDTITRLLIVFGQFNMPVVEELKLVTRITDMMRKYSNQPDQLKTLLVIVNALCVYSKDCCVELAQHETALEFLMSLITDSKDEAIVKVAEYALIIIDSVAAVEMGADRLLELNIVERLLPFMTDPTNTHLFRHIYTTLHNLTDFASMNGFGDEIIAKLLKYKDVLVDRGGDSATEVVREACTGFWTIFSCATPPPRDVSLKLIDRTLPIIPTDTTKLNIKKDAALLLANIAEVDFDAFEGKDLTKLFNYLAEYLINFDSAKEHAELLKIEREKEKEAQVKAGGVATEAPANNTDEENQEGQEEPADLHSASEELEDVSDDMDVIDEKAEAADSMDVDDYVEDLKPDLAKDAESPWPLNLLAYLCRFDYLKKIAIQNKLLLNKMFSLYEDKSLIYENHYMVMYFFSHIVLMPGWNSSKALDCIEEFALKAPCDIEWNFVFSLIAPYAHLLRKDNPVPLVVFGSWVIAHMSTSEPGRQVLKKELDPEVLKWLKAYPHPKVEDNMAHFTRNMKKKISRHH